MEDDRVRVLMLNIVYIKQCPAQRIIFTYDHDRHVAKRCNLFGKGIENKQTPDPNPAICVPAGVAIIALGGSVL